MTTVEVSGDRIPEKQDFYLFIFRSEIPKMGKIILKLQKNLRGKKGQNLYWVLGDRMVSVLPITEGWRRCFSTELRRLLDASVTVTKAGTEIETHLPTRRRSPEAATPAFLPEAFLPYFPGSLPHAPFPVSGLKLKGVKWGRKRK